LTPAWIPDFEIPALIFVNGLQLPMTFGLKRAQRASASVIEACPYGQLDNRRGIDLRHSWNLPSHHRCIMSDGVKLTNEVICPVCGRPMTFLRLIRRAFGENVNVFQCKPCGFSTTEPVSWTTPPLRVQAARTGER